MESLERYFGKFRKGIIGINQTFISPHGKQKLIYTDWTASGRLYRPIEDKLSNEFGPFVANTHTETSTSGAAMTLAYERARQIIKKHVNAGQNDVLITEGSGMTGVINKFQRILGLKISENLKEHTSVPKHLRPIVFLSHMEHHSNQTSWLETIAEVHVIPHENGLVSISNFEKLLDKYKADQRLKIVSITACSNVTGIQTPYHKIAAAIHRHNGLCFVDFACSAPYVPIDMHPKDPEDRLDAIFFSPHKFLGGPASSGVLIFNGELYKNDVPDNPGGGTVSFTNPWGYHSYLDDLEIREDGGTPAFLQTIKVALSIQLKESMGTENIKKREEQINEKLFKTFEKLPNIHLLAPNEKDRLGIFSFYVDDFHFNLVVKLLNDCFGIQARGGCSCAGTYGHFLLGLDKEVSKEISEHISQGCLIERPGWVRLSIHPTMTDSEVSFISNSLEELSKNIHNLSKDYKYLPDKNDYVNVLSANHFEQNLVESWFEIKENGQNTENKVSKSIFRRIFNF